jgi:hypothetical protein
VGHTNSRCEIIINEISYVADVHVLFVLEIRHIVLHADQLPTQ